MLTMLSAIVSLLSFRFRRRVSLELEVLAPRHQVAVLNRQRPGRPWLRQGDRLLWAWLYRAWTRCLKVMVLVKPATVVQWHRSRIPQVLALALTIATLRKAGCESRNS
jgi:putative transposase